MAERAGQARSTPLPKLTLPKGGGALRGIGEKRSMNAARGTAGFSVPIFTSPGRCGFGPTLSLDYDSGSGASLFGLGWQLALPAVARKTERKLPLYRDTAVASESDTFILSGTEDLVPLESSRRTVAGDGSYEITRYRPRTEGAYARIERWKREATGETHWRSLSRENVTSCFGRSSASRIADPGEPSHVFAWLLDEMRDDRGNVVSFQYKRESAENVDAALVHERTRLDPEAGFANLYPKRIRYGNRVPFEPADWLFEAVFDYGDHDPDSPAPAEDRPWPCRADPFSSFRSGFEVRTYRLCRRVLMFHRFAELGAAPCLVRSTDFRYDEDSACTLLVAATQTGWRKPVGSAVYRTKATPPVAFTYSKALLDPEVHCADARTFEHLPGGVDGSEYFWEDLDSEGLPGVISEHEGAWFYKRNLGGRLGALERIERKPAGPAFGSGRNLQDVASDGRQYLAQTAGATSGYWRLDGEGQWEPFTAFASIPATALDAPDRVRLDLDGDGRAEIVIEGDDSYDWYPSLGALGYGSRQTAAKPMAEDRRPPLVSRDDTEFVFTADMTGDGLQDVVRIRNGDVSYWPNLGWGRFAAKVTMSDAPWFDRPDQFEPARIRLADIDGTGTTDIVYLGANEIRIWRNCAGNRWIEGSAIRSFPQVHGLASIGPVDLLGNGTSCLVWSSPFDHDSAKRIQYIQLAGGIKPHLLVKVVNNLGAETHLEYAASTRFYLADRFAGQPWITRLPFPVQVVERVATIDRVGRNRFVTRYAYHHGFYDADEREFAGFGMVEQWDTEEFDVLADGDLDLDVAANWERASHVPPVLTRTWYHHGAYLRPQSVARQFAREYYRESENGAPAAMQLDDTVLPDGLDPQELREACRALRGSLLRQEVYALDRGEAQGRPYSVSERNYSVRCVARRGRNPHAVFAVSPRESLEFGYERALYDRPGAKLPDPRVRHSVALALDDFGNVLQSVAIAYGRRLDEADPALTQADRAEQKRVRLLLSEDAYTNCVDTDDAWRTPLAAESRTLELLDIVPAAPADPTLTPLFRFAELTQKIAAAPSAARKLVGHVRTIYRRDDLSGPLPLGRLESRALAFHEMKLALTPTLVAQVYGDRVTDAMLADACGYVHGEGDADWWTVSGRVLLSPEGADTPPQELAAARAHFFLPRRFRDPFGFVGAVRYDDYDLMPIESVDPLRNRVECAIDYRVLQPAAMTDANGNRSAVMFDTLGWVTGTAVMGKTGQDPGDSLDGFDPDPDDGVVAAFLLDPPGRARALLGDATSRFVYDLAAQPAVTATITRDMHVADARAGVTARLGVALSYSDGFGREIQGKLFAGSDRWITSGWTIHNNKGSPVRQFEAFDSASPAFEFAKAVGVSATIFYDPAGRSVAVVNPDGTWAKSRYAPWSQWEWDANDTALIADPLQDPDAGPYFRRSALPARSYPGPGAATHADTPAGTFLDSLGRGFLALADNGAAGKRRTVVAYDIQGNQRSVTDAAGRVVMRYDYDLQGARLVQSSMESGTARDLKDASGKTAYAWDGMERVRRIAYDELQRPTQVFIRDGDTAEILYELNVYGESQGETGNHRGRIFRQMDGSGTVTIEAYDFKGNILRTSRRFAQEYKAPVDWSSPVPLEPGNFVQSGVFDAMNRPIALALPDATVIRPSYDDAGQLVHVEAQLRGATAATVFVQSIDYDAAGRRTTIVYGNGVRTQYAYDPLTLRLAVLRTLRGNDTLQHLSYTHDPLGNITSIRDDAQQSIHFDGNVAEPHCEYTYDALYRLTSATGREHAGRRAQPETSWDDEFRTRLAHPNDGQAMRRYKEDYEYDEAGNILRLIHQAQNGNWTRAWDYQEASALEPAVHSNRLGRTVSGAVSGAYSYDAQGNMTAMPHLPLMRWNTVNQLQAVSRQVVTGGAVPEITYYVYDAGGTRVRKVTERAAAEGPAATRKSERLYLGAFEIHREYDGAGETPTLERQTLHVADAEVRVALVETKTLDRDSSAGLDAPLIRYQFGNHLGSACLEADAAGAVISYEEYSPFGSTSFQAGRSAAEVGLKRYRYIGKERDAESGLGYHGARYYAPWLLRWISADPAGLADGVNSYSYCANNPVKLLDPDGAQSIVYLYFAAVYEAPQARPKSPGQKRSDMTARYVEAGRMGMCYKDPAKQREADQNVGKDRKREHLPVQELRPYSLAEGRRADLKVKADQVKGLAWAEKSRSLPLFGPLTANIHQLDDEKAVQLDAMATATAKFATAVAALGTGIAQHEAAGRPLAPLPEFKSELKLEIPAVRTAMMGSSPGPKEPQGVRVSPNTGAPGIRDVNCSQCALAVVEGRGASSSDVADRAGIREGMINPGDFLSLARAAGMRTTTVYTPPDLMALESALRTYPPGTGVAIGYSYAGHGNGAHAITAFVGKRGEILYVDAQPAGMVRMSGPPPGTHSFQYFVVDRPPR